MEQITPSTSQPTAPQSTSNVHRFLSGRGWKLVLLLALAIYWLIRLFGPNVSTRAVVAAACAKVKSTGYNAYGEIPECQGEVIYHDGDDYIVVVRYAFPELDWRTSCACHVKAYDKGLISVVGMTQEYGYDLDYRARLEELCALWALLN